MVEKKKDNNDLWEILEEGMKRTRQKKDSMFNALNSNDVDFFKNLNLENENDETRSGKLLEHIRFFNDFIESDLFKEQDLHNYYSCISQILRPEIIVMSLYFHRKQNDSLDLISKNTINVEKKLLNAFIEEFKVFDFDAEYRWKQTEEKEFFVNKQIEDFMVLNKKALLESALSKNSNQNSSFSKKVKL